ncbi:hypothetical protein [Acidisphaera sp. L21]|uniref:hypothetical protein n=1 Tax=Acidisphaera sp. L21 TaxID=1641851 RepID=UPI00131C962F|nr:hypothetical protein [Acidisphaera sp. L21]
MPSRIPRDWLVYDSVENAHHDRCVDFFERPDKTCGFEEFRRDVEDLGAWAPVQYYGYSIYPSRQAALNAAVNAVGWFARQAEGSKFKAKG